MTDLIDPEELPFTTEELFEAFRLFCGEDAARQVADQLTAIAPSYAERSCRFRQPSFDV